MKTILITGMSATGKSTLINELCDLGYTAIDFDNDTYSIWADAESTPEFPDNEVIPGKDWIWHEERVLNLLNTTETDLLFVSGCASNMSKFYPWFNSIILLTTTEKVMADRLATRKGIAYGQTPPEVARILRLKQTIEPLLVNAADLVIDSNASLQSIMGIILQHANSIRVT